MFNKILIANRGEIACRVIRTARRMGIATVAVYSDADRNALHVTMADEAIHIGGSPSRESYLLGERVIEAARRTGAQAIHPGYGFLSENAEFCNACKRENIVFIGPPVKAIKAMGSKSAAKQIMEAAGVPLVPGYHGDDQDPAVLRQASDSMGYPVLLKATAGGGGKGMRQVWRAEEFDEALAAAKREALNAFGDERMLVEKYLTQPRHVEIQVFCDQQGRAVYLFERDCSVQRRHQKVIEEAPAPGMSQALRQQMGEAAIRAAQAIDYEGAGTVEFLLDSDGSFYFMEMNTRLQVEHPVTEMITGQDLVEWQLRVASGEHLPCPQEQLEIRGHAFEARIYAEDPDNDFLPVTGTLRFLQPPATGHHVRVDTGVRQGDEVSVFYDPMIAKLVVWDEDRERALTRLTRALAEYRISGMTTNLEFLYNLANCPAFRAAELDTGFIDKHHAEIFLEGEERLARDLPLAALYLVLRQQQQAEQAARHSRDPFSPWHQTQGWRLNAPSQRHFSLLLHEQAYPLVVEERRSGAACGYRIEGAGTVYCQDARGRLEGSQLRANLDGYQLNATVSEHDGIISLYTADSALSFRLQRPDLGEQQDAGSAGALNAPMNGTVVALLVEPGSKVAKGDALLVMEAMKMEHSLRAPADGRVVSFYYQAGDLVDGGRELLEFEQDHEA
ncbi:acetyl/propionyl/methylcrotonyl-CoA carboxylase subunit alpha [Aestuariirhabdus litorea]|uniref:Biotin carboxylase n=1 Tax=Aestuariirhabdus litorea TaxID=2528527 RepID=A0A3P3VLZ4_9GAMM|nr:acetyl/propionyl/methylcrotonyl-CoA carboxylase subunit alpha [Aestuariirhabdus litorea]RRJ83755.1 acetyl/propionyl/methylcrotonyl-CoA carboxylase subunit alpha [Aestuariirhabdus litorea]RWW96978.1 acetyl-CoA carboxylase biotin carboxylase subunit [Endozoicomonadaceae bacterium GTF-13]